MLLNVPAHRAVRNRKAGASRRRGRVAGVGERPAGRCIEHIASDHPQPRGNGLNGAGHNAQITRLVVKNRLRRPERGAVFGVDHRGNPVRAAIQRAAAAGGVSGIGNRIGRRIGIGAGVAEEYVQVRTPRLTRINDGIVESHVAVVARRTECAGSVAGAWQFAGRSDAFSRMPAGS